MDGTIIGTQRWRSQANAFDGVNPSSRAHSRYIGGAMLHDVLFKTTSNLTNVDLKMGSESIVDISVANLAVLNQYNKIYTATGFVLLNLADPTMKTLFGQTITGWNTPLGAEIRIGATFGAGASPAITASVLESAYNLNGDENIARARMVPRIRELQCKGGASGKALLLDDIHESKDGDEFLRRVHFYGNGHITKLRVLRDSSQLCEVYADELAYMQNVNGRAPQTGWLHFDPLMAGLPEEMFSTQNFKNLQFEVTLDGTLSEIPTIIESARVMPKPAGAK